MRHLARRLATEADYLCRKLLRRYCFQHDVITWRWRHRNCCARQRAFVMRVLGPWLRENAQR